MAVLGGEGPEALTPRLGTRPVALAVPLVVPVRMCYVRSRALIARRSSMAL